MLSRVRSRGLGLNKKTDDAAEPRSGADSPPVIRKNRAMAAGLAAVIVSSLISWGAASRIRSPAEVAARTAPPKPSAITVPVEKKVLASDVVSRGTVRYGAPQSVLLPGSSIRKGSPILTSSPEKGKDLNEGSVAFTISGRPALVLQGAVPAYRDITPGAVGDDVRQLQAALTRLGFKPGRTDGVYDDRTGLAVAAWYLKGGWSPSGPSDEQLSALRSAQADWFSAESDLLAAQEALTAARNDYEIAKQKSAVASRAANPSAPTTTATRSTTQDDQAAARSEQERFNAQARVKKARRDLQKAEEEEKAAQARLDEARTRKPPPSNEEYAALNKRSQDASAKVAAAREELTAAEEAAAAAGDRSSSSSADTSSGGGGANPPDQQVVLDAATAQAEVRKAADAVAFAQKKVGLAGKRTATGASGTKLGIQIPAGEILFFPTLPVRVDEAKLNVGEEAAGPVMTVTSSRLVVESGLSAADAKLVKEGDTVAIRTTDSGVEATGTVTQIADTPGTHGVDPQRFYLEVTPTGLDVSLNGASVVQTISVQTTQGEVLAVPVAALSMASDGTTRVQVQPAKGPARYVTVEPGLAAKGLVAVSPLQGELGPGDLVVVGANGSEPKEKGSSNGGK